jgi:hypothetical protein
MVLGTYQMLTKLLAILAFQHIYICYLLLLSNPLELDGGTISILMRQTQAGLGVRV